MLREGWRLWGGLEEEGTEAVDSSGVSLELFGASSLFPGASLLLSEASGFPSSNAAVVSSVVRSLDALVDSDAAVGTSAPSDDSSFFLVVPLFFAFSFCFFNCSNCVASQWSPKLASALTRTFFLAAATFSAFAFSSASAMVQEPRE